MSNENKKQMSKKVEFLIALCCVSLAGTLVLLLIPPEILSPYMDACRTLAINVHEVGFAECVQYMEANPGATGQDVVNYDTKQDTKQSTKIDELLNNPLEPSG